MSTLKGKTALVTGASRGIGKAIAVALGRAGANVAIVARATEKRQFKLPGTVDETARLVECEGVKAVPIPGDLTSEDEVRRVAQTALSQLGHIDVLVNNAAVDFLTPFLEIGRKRFDLMLELNLLAPFWLAKHLIPGMLNKGWGHVLNISSQAALQQFSGSLTYGMTKAALERFTLGLASELRDTPLSSNCLRIDIPIASEGFLLNFTDKYIDRSRWESVEVGAQAVLWMLNQPRDRLNGVNISVRQMRKQYGAPPKIPYVPSEELCRGHGLRARFS